MRINLLRKNTDTIVAAIVGFIIVLLYTQHSGIGISPDSIAYISAARNMVAGHGFLDYTGNSLVLFPLFYPFFLGSVMFVLQTDILVIAPYLNALLYACVIILSGVIMEQFKYKTHWYKRVLLVIITISPSLIEIYTMLWSETLFILLSLLFILFFHRYFRSHKTIHVFYAGIVVALAFDTRYAGATLAGTGCLLILFDKNLNWKRKLSKGAVFSLTSISLISLNLIRNIVVKGALTGNRQKGNTPLINNISYSGNVLSDWFNFQWEAHLFFEILAVAVFLLFLLFFIRNFRHWKAYYSYENIAVAFFIVYISFIILSSTISRYERINNRLLGPAFLSFVWISTCQLPKWRHQMAHKRLNKIFLAFSLGISFLLIGSYAAINSDNLSWMGETGIPGYSEDTWTHSRMINYLQKHDEIFEAGTTEIYSNHSQAVYFLTGHSVEGVPERVYKKDVLEFVSSDPSYLIWFKTDPNPDILNLKEINKLKEMKLVHAFNDGAIFSLRNK